MSDLFTLALLGGGAYAASRLLKKSKVTTDASGQHRMFTADARQQILSNLAGAGLEPAANQSPGVFFMRLVQNNPGGVPAETFIRNSLANGLSVAMSDAAADLPSPKGDIFVAIGGVEAQNLTLAPNATMALL